MFSNKNASEWLSDAFLLRWLDAKKVKAKICGLQKTLQLKFVENNEFCESVAP